MALLLKLRVKKVQEAGLHVSPRAIINIDGSVEATAKVQGCM